MVCFCILRCGCKKSMNHAKEGVPHESKSRCRYSHQYDNRVYTCKVSSDTRTRSEEWRRKGWPNKWGISQACAFFLALFSLLEVLMVLTRKSDPHWTCIFAWRGHHLCVLCVICLLNCEPSCSQPGWCWPTYLMWLLFLLASVNSLVLANFSEGCVQETGKFSATIMVFIVEIFPWCHYW